MTTDLESSENKHFDRHTSSVRYEVLAFLSVSAAIAYLTRNAVGVAESTIRDDLGLTLRQSGWFMGTFFWSYALLQLPAGWVAHHRGAKFAMLLFTLAGSVATFCIGLAPGLWLLLTSQLIMGAAQAGLFPSATLTIANWIPISRRALACGVLAMGMQIGAVLSSLCTGRLIDSFQSYETYELSWRWVFFVYSVPGFLWAFLFMIRFHNRPQDHPTISEQERDLIQPVTSGRQNSGRSLSPTPWKKIFLNQAIWFLCGQQACRAGGYMFFASWFPTFLQKTQNVSVKDSGSLQALVFGGTLIGCIIGGWLTDSILKRTGNLRWSRTIVGTTFLSICSLLILAAWFVESTSVAVGLIALGALLAALVGPCAYSATIDLGGDYVPQVFGLMNMTGNIAAAVCPIVVAEIFARSSNWSLILALFSAVYLVGALCWIFVDSSQRIEADDSLEGEFS